VPQASTLAEAQAWAEGWLGMQCIAGAAENSGVVPAEPAMRETPIGIGQHRPNGARKPRVRTYREVFQHALGCAQPQPCASRPAELGPAPQAPRVAQAPAEAAHRGRRPTKRRQRRRRAPTELPRRGHGAGPRVNNPKREGLPQRLTDRGAVVNSLSIIQRVVLLKNEGCEAIADLFARCLIGRCELVSQSAVGSH
jgi:hypothetical protein